MEAGSEGVVVVVDSPLEAKVNEPEEGEDSLPTSTFHDSPVRKMQRTAAAETKADTRARIRLRKTTSRLTSPGEGREDNEADGTITVTATSKPPGGLRLPMREITSWRGCVEGGCCWWLPLCFFLRT